MYIVAINKSTNLSPDYWDRPAHPPTHLGNNTNNGKSGIQYLSLKVKSSKSSSYKKPVHNQILLMNIDESQQLALLLKQPYDFLMWGPNVH